MDLKKKGRDPRLVEKYMEEQKCPCTDFMLETHTRLFPQTAELGWSLSGTFTVRRRDKKAFVWSIYFLLVDIDDT